MDSQLYKKVGRKYIKVGYSDGCHRSLAEGIWLVTDKPGCHSSSCILQLGDMPKLYPYANLVMHRDTIIRSIYKYFEEKNDDIIAHGNTTYGATELTDRILKNLGEQLSKNGENIDTTDVLDSLRKIINEVIE